MWEAGNRQEFHSLWQSASDRTISVKTVNEKRRKIMHHKRRRHKTARAGCLMCKPNKMGKGMENQLGHVGFGNLRREQHAAADIKEAASRS